MRTCFPWMKPLVNRRTWCLVGLLGVGLTAPRPAQAQLEVRAPAVPVTTNRFFRYNLLRGEDNFGFLAQPGGDSLLRNNLFTPLKYLPLGHRPGYFLTLGADLRYQYEAVQHRLWGLYPVNDRDADGYVLQRHLVHTDWRLGSHFRVFAQLLNDNIYGRAGGPRPYIDRDILDVYQLFADVSVKLGQQQVGLRVGRQEFTYGAGRLLTMREGPNNRQSFDAVRLALARDRWRLDVLAGRPLLTNAGILDDRGDPQQVLWGALATRALPRLRGGLDLFYLGLNKHAAPFTKGTGHERRQSLGARLWSDPAPFGYDLFFTGQWGRFGEGRIGAYYASAYLFYHFAQLPLSPTLRLAGNRLSGDQDPAGPDLQTFNILFAMPFSTAVVPIGPGNLTDARPGVELHFTRAMLLRLDVDWQWRSSQQDGLYTPDATPLPFALARTEQEATLPRYVGVQYNAEFAWQATQNLAVGMTYALFPAGDYLRAVTPGRTLSYYRPTLLFQF